MHIYGRDCCVKSLKMPRKLYAGASFQVFHSLFMLLLDKKVEVVQVLHILSLWTDRTSLRALVTAKPPPPGCSPHTVSGMGFREVMAPVGLDLGLCWVMKTPSKTKGSLGSNPFPTWLLCRWGGCSIMILFSLSINNHGIVWVGRDL